MIRIVFVCNFSSVHARTFVGYLAQHPEFEVHVVSSFAADAMEGVHLIELDRNAMSALSLASSIGRFIGELHPAIYRCLTVTNRKRVTQGRLVKIDQLDLGFEPDIIHAHRTQPEGILGCSLAKKYANAKFMLTTWGQDFIFWAEHSRWLRDKSQEAVDRLDHAFPDNARDARILRDYNYKNPLSVMVATGGLDTDYLAKIEAEVGVSELRPGFKFLSVRGYENSTIRIRILLNAFKLFREQTGEGHFYIDGHYPGDPGRDSVVQNWIDDLGLQDDVNIVHLKREEMFAYMMNCDCYVSATRADGLPLSLLESLFFGQTPIVLDHESTSQLPQQFPNMLVFDRHDEGLIAERWLEAYRNPMSETSRKRNRNSIMRAYDRDTQLQSVVEIYKKSIGVFEN